MDQPRRPRVAIAYGRQGNRLLRAAWMAQELLATFGEDLAEVALRPATGGAFPDIRTLGRRGRDRVAPERALGHVDRV